MATGSGAVGSVIGAALYDTGLDVLLVGRKPHMETINDEGLTFREAERGTTQTLEIDANSLLKPADTVLLGMKMPDLQDGLVQVPETAPEATVVPLQNGVRADDMAADTLERKQVVGGIVMFGAEFLEPGQVTLTRPGPLLIGDPWKSPNSAVENVADLFTHTGGLSAKIHPNISGARWTKLLVNLNNALPAIIGEPLQIVYRDKSLAWLATGAFWEGTRTAQAADRPLASLPDIPRLLLTAVSYIPHRLGWRLLRRQILQALSEEAVLPSTLQSIIRGGSGEIDYLNGEIVALGSEIGYPTPINRALVEMVNQVHETGEFLDREIAIERIMTRIP